MIKFIVLFALFAMVYAGNYKFDYGFTAGGGHGHHGGWGHAKVMHHGNPHHYKFAVKEGDRYHHQTADTAHGGWGHGGGGGF